MTVFLVFLDNISTPLRWMSLLAMIACILIFVARHEANYPFMSDQYAYERKRSISIVKLGLAFVMIFVTGWGLAGISGPYLKIQTVVAKEKVEPDMVTEYRNCLQYRDTNDQICSARAQRLLELSKPKIEYRALPYAEFYATCMGDPKLPHTDQQVKICNVAAQKHLEAFVKDAK